MATSAFAEVLEPRLPLVPTQEEKLLRESVCAISLKYGPEYFVRQTAADEPPTALRNELGEAGFPGVNIPEEYDGGGLGMYEPAAVAEEVAYAGCPLLRIVVSPAIAGSILARHGTPEQKDRWLRGLGTGQKKIAFAITEPDAGSNSHAEAGPADSSTCR